MLKTIYPLLNGSDHLFRYDGPLTNLVCGIVGSKISSYDEKLALYVGEERFIFLCRAIGYEHTDVGVQFIDGAVALKAIAAFRDALTTYE